MRSSFSYSSRCERIEIHSPDAIENAPATSPATPASSTMLLLLVPPATPMTSEKFDTRPSFMPNTAARSAPPTLGAVAALGRGDATARRGCPAWRRWCGPRPRSCCAIASVASASAR